MSLSETSNGWRVLPASLRAPDGTPRFALTFPAYRMDDSGAKLLVESENAEGYELPTRNLLEKFLRPGDLFIDVGAHWGYFTCQAATHPAGDIRVVAFEPDPENAGILYANLLHNDVAYSTALICAACGHEFDLAPLVSNSSMGHSVRAAGLGGGATQGPPKFVMVITLDSMVPCFPNLADRRVILKIDAEGYETKVIAGATKLLDSGRVGLIIWELGRAFEDGSQRQAVVEMVESLTRRGYRHFRAPGMYQDGALVPFDPADDYVVCNIFSFAPGMDVPQGGAGSST
jgi:FkbM family methyltransferase